ncbi:MAG: PASTA domain-containing protein [Pyrinomonadaceae bacterium]
MSLASNALSALQRIGLVILIGLVFLFGLSATVYLSLRSPEVTVPNVVGQDRFEAERTLENAGLNFRVRATRPSNQVKADTVLFQLPRAGEVVKTGQTVAMDISRTAKEGEASEAVVTDKKVSEEKAAENRNTNADAVNENENRPRRPRIANKNANANINGNVESRSNANANRARTTGNVTNGNVTGTGSGSTTNLSQNQNVNRNSNQNVNRRPVAPRPTPSNP